MLALVALGVVAGAAPAPAAASRVRITSHVVARAVRVDVTAPGRPRRVTLFVDGSRMRSDARAPFRFRFRRLHPRRLRSGRHRVRAVARYRRGSVTGTSSFAIAPARVPGPDVGPDQAGAGAGSWKAGFEGGTFADWTWWHRPEFDAGEFGVVDSGTDGVPAHSGTKLARFETTRGQVDGGRQHAKLYKEWAVRAPETTWTDDAGHRLQALPGAGRDVSGTYSAWYYLPAAVSWTSEWSNIMQFKLVFPAPDGSVGSEAHWFVDLTSADAWAQRPQRADGTTPAAKDPVLVVANWTMKKADGSSADWNDRMVAPPVGRWFQLSATVVQGRSVRFALDGVPWFEGTPADWPVGLRPTPTHPADDFSGWIFGTGLYGGPGRLYVDDAAFTPET